MAGLMTFATHKLAITMFKETVLDNELKFYVAAFHNVTFVYISCIIDASLMSLPNVLISYVIAMLRQLSQRMENLGVESSSADHNPEREKQYMKDLVGCVRAHRKIREVAGGIEQHFSPIVLVQGLMSTIILCTIIYFLSLVSMLC